MTVMGSADAVGGMQDWHKPQIWSSRDEHSVNERNSYLLLAVRTCAVLRIDIKAFRGNLRKSG